MRLTLTPPKNTRCTVSTKLDFRIRWHQPLRLMKPDPAFLAELRDAMRHATRDLETLKTVKSDEVPKVTQLLKEMRTVLFKDCARVAKEARSESSKAKNSSARHSVDLAEIKKRARRAAELLQQAKLRHVPTR